MNFDKPIEIIGAHHHNLKNINIKIPRDCFVIITGVSGSGKSTLAFDIIYAEGQRKYVESLSAYARQFLERLQKPEVEEIRNLSPTIAIEQRKSGYSPRSTVGTITEIYDYLRLLFARAGQVFCPHCKVEIKGMSVDEIVDSVLREFKGKKIRIFSPVIRGRKGEFKREFQSLQKQGFVKFRVDGEITEDPLGLHLDEKKKHTVEVLIDTLRVLEEEKTRLFESVETALRISKGLLQVEDDEEKGVRLWSEKYACPECGFTFREIAPRNFSFNSPYGACGECDGLGYTTYLDENLIIPDKSLPLKDAILPLRGRHAGYYTQMLECVADHFGFKLSTPFKSLPQKIQRIILYGSDDEEIDFYIRTDKSYYFTKPFEGIIPLLMKKYRENPWDNDDLEDYMREMPCRECKGARLKREYLFIKIGGKNIHELCTMSISDLNEFIRKVEFRGKFKVISEKILSEIINRLNFLEDVGLGYLTLDRTVSSLSGGEYQRTKLATQLGSGLVGVIYVLDEPTIGLHPRDTSKMIDRLIDLTRKGNTVIVVEHDPETIKRADWIIDLGPLAGHRGGEVVASGTLNEIINSPLSITGKYLKGELRIDVPPKRRKPKGKIILQGCTHNNLKNIDVQIPLGVFVCVTGVSGSGKSSLIIDTLYPALNNYLSGYTWMKSGKYSRILVDGEILRVIIVDQKPIGKTPRSNPATYIDVFKYIREVFAKTREARIRGYKPGRFSFNVRGGRCEACEGEGTIKIDMQFLPDLYVTCDVCGGKRFNSETLEITFKGKNIYQILESTVEEALEIFQNFPIIKSKLSFLMDVGLGYLKLGQPAPTLSGGESQRIKLAKELTKKERGGTIYILDEPTVGLHPYDINKLLQVLNKLVDRGNTVIVIEHNLDVIKCADWIIDIGPEGGDKGGQIVGSGTPEEIVKIENSHTGKYLKNYLLQRFSEAAGN